VRAGHQQPRPVAGADRLERLLDAVEVAVAGVLGRVDDREADGVAFLRDRVEALDDVLEVPGLVDRPERAGALPVVALRADPVVDEVPGGQA
jgi:hypothetical protein